MILPIKHKVDWELICHGKQTINRISAKIETELTTTTKAEIQSCSINTLHKFETPCTRPFVITQCFTNVTVNLQCGAKQIEYNIHLIKLYKYDTNVEYINPENMYDYVNI